MRAHQGFFFSASTIVRRFPGSGVPQGLSLFPTHLSCTHAYTHTPVSPIIAWKYELWREEREGLEQVLLLTKSSATLCLNHISLWLLFSHLPNCRKDTACKNRSAKGSQFKKKRRRGEGGILLKETTLDSC